MNSQHHALTIIRGEHQALGAVVDALGHVADEIVRGKLTPDYKLLWSVIYYIEEFPETLHHPKEEAVLFPLIRQRSNALDAALDDLAHQHHNSRPHLDALKTLLGRMEAEIPGAAEAFNEKVQSYSGFQFKHMAQEESVVLPHAIQVLLPSDWDQVAESFAQNNDPLHQRADKGSDWFRRFYTRIVTLMPEPWGVGSRH
jgi:hemerythrin-like domain-containing protein